MRFPKISITVSHLNKKELKSFKSVPLGQITLIDEDLLVIFWQEEQGADLNVSEIRSVHVAPRILPFPENTDLKKVLAVL